MKNKIKYILLKLLKPLIKKLGYVKLEPSNLVSNKNTLLYDFFTSIKEVGFDAKHIIDVGANRATWTRETLKYFPNSFYTLLEPQEQLQSSYKDLLDSNTKINVLVKGAGSKTGSFPFTIVDRDDSCTFKYTEEEASKLGFKQVEIPVITLNELVTSLKNIPFPDIVKIDAEGLDLEVLKGANDLFGKTEIFMVEASVNCYRYKNTALDVINYMNQKDYMLFDITDLNRPFNPKVLWLVELVFIKRNGQIDSKINEIL